MKKNQLIRSFLQLLILASFLQAKETTITSSGQSLTISIPSSASKFYLLKKSSDLKNWINISNAIRGNDNKVSETIPVSNDPKAFFQFEIHNLFAPITIDRALADQLIGDGTLEKPGTYQSNSNEAGTFSLASDLGLGAPITIEGTWSWAPNLNNPNEVRLMMTITKYIDPNSNFTGNPDEYAMLFGSPVPSSSTYNIVYGGPRKGTIDGIDHLSDGSQEASDQETFNL